jgi:hypothetical protein
MKRQKMTNRDAAEKVDQAMEYQRINDSTCYFDHVVYREPLEAVGGEETSNQIVNEPPELPPSGKKILTRAEREKKLQDSRSEREAELVAVCLNFIALFNRLLPSTSEEENGEAVPTGLLEQIDRLGCKYDIPDLQNFVKRFGDRNRRPVIEEPFMPPSTKNTDKEKIWAKVFRKADSLVFRWVRLIDSCSSGIVK